jgi:succinyl-diaminopimelate desuccinylase
METLLRRIAEEDSGFRYTLEKMRSYDSAQIPANSQIAELVRRYSRSIAGAPAEPFGMLASTDVRNFVNDANIPAITWGPGSLEQAHTFNEYIEIRQVKMAIQVLLNVARDLLT